METVRSRRGGAALALAAIFLAAHLPVLPASPEDLDSINFALGVRHFDVVMLTLRGEPPIVSHWRPAHVKVSAGGRVVAEETLFTRFDLRVRIPAELVAGTESTITIETDVSNVSAEGMRRSLDRRRLGLRVSECEVRPVF